MCSFTPVIKSALFLNSRVCVFSLLTQQTQRERVKVNVKSNSTIIRTVTRFEVNSQLPQNNAALICVVAKRSPLNVFFSFALYCYLDLILTNSASVKDYCFIFLPCLKKVISNCINNSICLYMLSSYTAYFISFVLYHTLTIKY